jgi:hypothetical protein
MSQKDQDGSLLMKAVEVVAISPANARAVAERYEQQYRSTSTRLTDREITDLTVKKIINRYCKMAAAVGGASSLAGVIPGIAEPFTAWRPSGRTSGWVSSKCSSREQLWQPDAGNSDTKRT